MNSGISLAIAAAALFGLSVPIAKILVGDVHPLTLAGLLYIGSGVGLAAVMIFRRLSPRTRHTAVAWPRAADIPSLGAAILFGGVAGPALLMFGLQSSTATAASLLLNLESVFTTLIAWFLFRENFDRRIAAGILLIIVGSVFLSWTSPKESEIWTGTPLVAAACLCWALDNNFTRRVSGSDALTIACIKGLAAGLTNLILTTVLATPWPKASLVVAAGIVGFLGYGVSLVLFVMALRNLGTARTGAYFAIAPFFGALLAIPLHGEPFTLTLGLAAVLMSVGVWLHLTERHAHEHLHERMMHTHSHRHDEHHRHAHVRSEAASEPHTHKHTHEPLAHDHPHFPDIHHRHTHSHQRDFARVTPGSRRSLGTTALLLAFFFVLTLEGLIGWGIAMAVIFSAATGVPGGLDPLTLGGIGAVTVIVAGAALGFLASVIGLARLQSRFGP